jgi:hypothetical protein
LRFFSQTIPICVVGTLIAGYGIASLLHQTASGDHGAPAALATVAASAVVLVDLSARMLRVRLTLDKSGGVVTVTNLFRTVKVRASNLQRVDLGAFRVSSRYGRGTDYPCVTLLRKSDNGAVKVLATLGTQYSSPFQMALVSFCTTFGIECLLDPLRPGGDGRAM